MGRPYLTVVWSNSGNYPPGPDPWAARPLAVLPAGTFFTPNTKPSAEDFNYLFGNLVADLNTVYQQTGTHAGQNWHPTTAALVKFGGAAFDTINGRWMFGINDTAPATGLWYTNRPDSGFITQYGNNVTAHATDKIQSVLVDVSGLHLVGIVNSAGTEIHEVHGATFPNWALSVLINDGTDIQLDSFGGQFIGFSSKGPTSNSFVVNSSTGLSGSWSVATHPASLNNVVRWRTAKSSTAILAISKGEVSQTKYMRSTDGSTWTEKTISLAAGAAAQGICFCQGPNGPAFVVIATNSGGSGLDTWISYDDGLTFTKVASIAGFNAWDVAALGTLLVAIDQTTVGGTSYTSRFAFSIDGGLTWHHVFNEIEQGNLYATATTGQDSRIFAGDTNFYAANSNMQSYSFDQGIPSYTFT